MDDRTTEWDNAHFFHPWEGMADHGGLERFQVESGAGIHVTDADGKRMIDGPGGMWCVQIGYGRNEMGEAMAEQARQLAYFSPFNNTTPVTARLASEIAARTPGDLNHVFFTTGGSTAVDTALRFIHFRNNVLGRPEKKIVISRQKAYHGSTYLSASMSGKERDHLWLDKADDLAHFLPDVTPSRRPEGMSMEAFLDEKVADLESAINTLGANRVAALIAEPVLAFGRLGHWFASEPVFGMVPDIITCAKGMTSGYVPMGAAIISDRLVADVSGDNAQGATFSNGYTYSGHPVSAAAALKNIEIIEREGLLENVRNSD